MEGFQRTFSPCFLSSYASSSNPVPLSIDLELWTMAEQRAHEILCTIQPNIVSELKRKEVINYIQGLINGYFGNEVYPFGSAPLKTYLPDGDIDLTALCEQNMEEDLAKNVCNILKCQEDSEFQVKDVQYIHAQVKIVKCTVKNISVDISFNQLAGLCTLCFLEQVDQLIGKDHLFKRSILLVKAWCYYESRLLGAHHGLISTYALETMVLYIINFYHGSLCGPLEVLYRFLEYYSTFDWDNYCVSINGPVSLSSFTETLFEAQGEEHVGGLLLSREFLRNCRDIYSVPIRVQEGRGQEFPIRRLNILDPLKYYNNLGRSVSRGNFCRIIRALSYGASKLSEVLMLPGESVGGALEKFFATTLERNGRGERPDVQAPVPVFGTGRTEISDLSGDYDSYYGGLQHGQWYYYYDLPVYVPPTLIPSQMWDENVMDTLAQSVWGHQNVIYQSGTDIFVPALPLYYPNASQISAATYGLERTGRSRGTGTYIPDMTHNFYGDTRHKLTLAADSSFPQAMQHFDSSFPQSMQHFMFLSEESHEERGKVEEDSSPQASEEGNKVEEVPSPQKSPEEGKNKVEEVPSERGECQSSIPLRLPVKESPSLSSNEKSTPTPTEVSESSEPVANTQQVQHSSPTPANIEFGTYKITPAQEASTSGGINNQAIAFVSHPVDPLQCATVVGRQEQKESSEGQGKKIEPYQLADSADFPPLASQT